MADVEAMIELLGEPKGMGVQIAIDDFGTGYSSLSYLRRLPADVLKIAKPFVDEMGGAGEQARLLGAIISLGETLQMLTVAEGVEFEYQAEGLRMLGCDLAQGFHFSRPLAPGPFGQHLRGGLNARDLAVAEPGSANSDREDFVPLPASGDMRPMTRWRSTGSAG